MKRLLPLSIILLLSLQGFSQFYSDPTAFHKLNEGDSAKHFIQFNAYQSIQTNGISNGLFNSAYSGAITEDAKSNALQRVKETNLMGSEIDLSLNYKIRLKKFTLTAGLQYFDISSSKFSEDLFKLYLNGNAQFEGQTANLAPLNQKRFGYQKLSLGLEKEIKGKNLFLGGSLSLIRAFNYTDIDITKGEFYTAPDGEYLTLDMEGEMLTTSASEEDGSRKNHSFQRFRGLGASLQLYGQKQFGKNSLTFQVKDLGFVSYQQLDYRNFDTTITFEGAELGYPFNFDGFDTEKLEGSMYDAIAEKESGRKKKIWMPTTLQVEYERMLRPDKLSMTAGVRYTFINGYRPRIWARAHFYLPLNFEVAPVLAWGGLGDTDFGLKIGKQLGRNVFLSTELFFLENLIVPNATKGQGGQVGLTAMF